MTTPRANPLLTKSRSAGNGTSKGLSDHSGRQGTIINMTPSVAHKNTKNSTPTRRTQRRAVERCRELSFAAVAASPGDASEAVSARVSTPVGTLSKGSLGSEIIARVVVGCRPGSSPWYGRGTHSIPCACRQTHCCILRLQSLYALGHVAIIDIRTVHVGKMTQRAGLVFRPLAS